MEKIKQDNVVQNLKGAYKKTLEVSFIISLLLLSALFFSFRTFESGYVLEKVEIDSPIIVSIPPTEILRKPPKPIAPTIPIAVDDDEILDQTIIEYDKIDITALLKDTPPPEDDDDKIYRFIAFGKQPKLIKKAIPSYPAMAQKAGLEGRVVLNVLIGKKGEVERVEIVKSIPMLDEAAVAAAWKCKFSPGIQRDKFVRVWMSIPFDFKLR